MSKIIKHILLFGVVAATLSACGDGGYRYRSRAPYPPPPPRGYYGAVGVAPGPGFVWIAGYHDWRGRDYAWVPGRWMRPPHPRARWKNGYWTQRGHRHVWVSPRWHR